ncbi:MAG: hypothetical protein WCF85_02970 [Rhodospirillaceae bacterium]
MRRFATILTIAAFAVLVVPSAAALAADVTAYATEADAAKACGTDPVVWDNVKTKVYHTKGARWYGKSKHGAYVCRADADKAGHRVAGTPKPPKPAAAPKP